MYYVYILRGLADGRIYTGFSADLKKRIRQHNAGEVYTTRRMGDSKLIYYEAFAHKQDARERELYIKTTQGKRTLKIMLKHTFAPVV